MNKASWETDVNSNRDLRYEIKRVMPATEMTRLVAWLRLHGAGFHVAYPPRWVNNIYFDTESLSSVSDNLAGVARRVKVRLRWYGQSWRMAGATLEFKCKQGLLGWKTTHRLKCNLDLAAERWSTIIDAIRTDLPDQALHALNFASRAVLINRYRRLYYVSATDSVRVTVDNELSAYSQWADSRPNLSRAAPGHDRIVVEFKANADAWESLSEAINQMPGTVSKHSKYLAGICDAYAG